MATCSTFSAAAELAGELEYFQELPVVLTASRLVQPLSEVPNAMTVIDRELIVASGARSIVDLLKLVPGMYVSYYKGGQPFVSYHGSTDQYARRMQVMIDGRSVYLPPTSTVSWANLPITIDDIERIEVVRGPAAASHGANSTQGVISIVTRDAGAFAGGQLSITRGNKGVNDVAARFGQRGESLDYRVTLAYATDNGYDNLTRLPGTLSPATAQAFSVLNNGYDSNQARMLNYRAEYRPNTTDRLDVQFGFNHDVQGVGFTDKNPTLLNPGSTNANTVHDLIANSNFVQMGWLRQFENASEISLRYSHIRQDQHEAFPVYLGGLFFADPVTQSVHVSRDEIELQHILPLFSRNRLVYGAAYRMDRVKGEGWLPPLQMRLSSDVATSEFRLFAHDEWRIASQWLLNSGAMYERDALGHERASPRVALHFHVDAQHTIRLGTSVAYRTPAMTESRFPVIQPGALIILSPAVTSPNLVPERMVSREIGYLGNFPSYALSVDVRLFDDQLSNGIFYDRTITGTFVNGMTANYQGVEVTIKHQLDENKRVVINLAHELARSNAPALVSVGYGSMRPAYPTISDVLTGSIPKNSGSLLYAQNFADGVSYSAAYYYQDPLQPFDRGLVDYQPAQQRVDLRLAKRLNVGWGLKGELAAVIQNLFNHGYTEYVANNVFNRRGFVNLKLDM